VPVTRDDLEGGNISADKIAMVRDPADHLEGPQTADDPGEMVFDDATGAWLARDDIGVFNLRQTAIGSRIQLLIFKADGGLVYDGNGDLLIKESDP